MYFKKFSFICAVAAFANVVQGEALVKRERSPTLAKRQSACDPGWTLCGSIGLTDYCAEPGYKCCSILESAPEEATCCDSGYADLGYYCCSGFGSCQIGETCIGCNADSGSPGTTAETPTLATSTTPLTTPPPELTTTFTQVTYYYWTYTITYYYWQYYWIYVPTLSESRSTSSEVTTTYITSVYAANSGDALSSVEAITATLSYPTPDSATELPPLETSSAKEESSTSRSSISIKSRTTTISSSTSSPATASASSRVTAFSPGPGNGSARVSALVGSLGAWLLSFGVVVGALGVFL
ncbi:hypothetical protein BU23DRAFT_551116 [Bimuria novae-zelandiae CBS 107.79]|uniref:Uncharacterized protein n=1 Tax=Bimuria novae-zelandiae CBS 107.79 TaxID=1447943 RepID=A0A6A5VKI0_9PLEO|nr:hypothetical protein BU23DRAFT_551116 [Bimuria novae-zelandiae CBS 107.79]